MAADAEREPLSAADAPRFSARTTTWAATWPSTVRHPCGPRHLFRVLRTAVGILLSSRFSMWMAWGPQLTFFCNAATGDTLGSRSIRGPWACR